MVLRTCASHAGKGLAEHVVLLATCNRAPRGSQSTIQTMFVGTHLGLAYYAVGSTLRLPLTLLLNREQHTQMEPRTYPPGSLLPFNEGVSGANLFFRNPTTWTGTGRRWTTPKRGCTPYGKLEYSHTAACISISAAFYQCRDRLDPWMACMSC
ncbi:hypothetical protein N658DRAFT_256836 [Parathielavia hyrcaniae]|uniref:Uncharacterized protein n=1 Tax=Parathielavia hyrcaniae TaxID=113614 RepID=A0AAN6SXY7_9PEZI|nr:hypothetical protein N658DRAFT_256836 [Parathielavia hyrcaniae]